MEEHTIRAKFVALRAGVSLDVTERRGNEDQSCEEDRGPRRPERRARDGKHGGEPGAVVARQSGADDGCDEAQMPRPWRIVIRQAVRPDEGPGGRSEAAAT